MTSEKALYGWSTLDCRKTSKKNARYYSRDYWTTFYLKNLSKIEFPDKLRNIKVFPSLSLSALCLLLKLACLSIFFRQCTNRCLTNDFEVNERSERERESGTRQIGCKVMTLICDLITS